MYWTPNISLIRSIGTSKANKDKPFSDLDGTFTIAKKCKFIQKKFQNYKHTTTYLTYVNFEQFFCSPILLKEPGA
jgi:SET domain-containing protein